MLKNLALVSVIAFADAVKLDCCPTTSCCDCDGDNENKNEQAIEPVGAEESNLEEAIRDEVNNTLEVIEGGNDAVLDQESENVIDEVLDGASDDVDEAIEDASEEAAIVSATEDAINEAIKD